jgi:hypothetical protein
VDVNSAPGLVASSTPSLDSAEAMADQTLPKRLKVVLKLPPRTDTTNGASAAANGALVSGKPQRTIKKVREPQRCRGHTPRSVGPPADHVPWVLQRRIVVPCVPLTSSASPPVCLPQPARMDDDMDDTPSNTPPAQAPFKKRKVRPGSSALADCAWLDAEQNLSRFSLTALTRPSVAPLEPHTRARVPGHHLVSAPCPPPHHKRTAQCTRGLCAWPTSAPSSSR